MRCIKRTVTFTITWTDLALLNMWQVYVSFCCGLLKSCESYRLTFLTVWPLSLGRVSMSMTTMLFDLAFWPLVKSSLCWTILAFATTWVCPGIAPENPKKTSADLHLQSVLPDIRLELLLEHQSTIEALHNWFPCCVEVVGQYLFSNSWDLAALSYWYLIPSSLKSSFIPCGGKSWGKTMIKKQVCDLMLSK